MKKLTLPKLPYKYNALEPIISKRIMELHHDIHHQGYVNAANQALESLTKARKGKKQIDYKSVLKSLSFNLNGHLMHSLFWQNMRSPNSKNEPMRKIRKALIKNFGSIVNFKNEFSKTTSTVEGSGWGALVKNKDNDLLVIQIEKHNLLHLTGFTPILVNDVWEHAYYLDYANKRDEYVDQWWSVINWDEVEKRLLK